VSAVRFANRPPVWRVDDRRDVPVKPQERQFAHLLYFADAFVIRKATDAMDLEAPVRAKNVNSVDEVPDSTWFVNRIGVRSISAAEMRRGPNTDDGPVAPYTIKGTKVGGKSVGFIMKDSRGVKYVMKFDEKAFPVIETATDVVVQRLLWAIGYYVPEDSVFYFRREDLLLAADAAIKDVFGNSRPMTERDLAGKLALVSRNPDGRYRALASKFLPGVPIGGFSQRGTRPDDPNDTIAHEHRREVRALQAIYSWLQATDVKEDNTLDVWVADPEDHDHHYVIHYLVDFGKSMGANAMIPRFLPDGHLPRLDVVRSLAMLAGLGLVRQPWEGTEHPDIVGLGFFDHAHYEPAGFSPQQPYRPFRVADELDGFWGTKLVMRLTPELIRVAVEQGRYPDPRAVDYLTDTLVARQRRLGGYWFRRVNPLDRFRVTDRRLCFSDLLLAHGLATPAEQAMTGWWARAFDYAGRPLGWQRRAVATAGRPGWACLSGVRLAPDEQGYTIVQINTQRGGASLAPVEVHLARAPGTGHPRIIGIERRRR
jgi:hypothetical protein